MARARNIKPGFFKNEQLAECSPLARLLFAGLWCLADRDGRLEDRPKRIRAEVLPYDDGSVEDLLAELQNAGFILRYTASSGRYIQVLNFGKHQNPHHREPVSTIPAPCLPDTSPELAQGQPQAKPEPAVLIPDSLNLIPDSKPLVVCEQTPHEEIIALYHEILPMCPRVRKWTAARQQAMRARWRENPELEYWRNFFVYVSESEFLTGKSDRRQGATGPPFLADLEWLINSANHTKTVEGKYHRE